jgi:hypothetical protein
MPTPVLMTIRYRPFPMLIEHDARPGSARVARADRMVPSLALQELFR